MRSVEKQLEINKNILKTNLKKLKTSINAFEEDLAKERYNYLTYSHLEDDALVTILTVEKILLLQLMKDTDDPA